MIRYLDPPTSPSINSHVALRVKKPSYVGGPAEKSLSAPALLEASSVASRLEHTSHKSSTLTTWLSWPHTPCGQFNSKKFPYEKEKKKKKGMKTFSPQSRRMGGGDCGLKRFSRPWKCR
ncbi:hypothetical protein TNCV_4067781 [Trichonephila clavipes]|nr:hypothetical protein TNCV_4067781 [Trichonephila clavipes]